MKHSKNILMTAVLMTSMSAAHAIETTITFDDVIHTNITMPSYSIEDVTFEGLGRTNPTGNFKFTSDTISSPDYSGIFLESGGIFFTGFKISFDSAINGLSMNAGMNRNNWELTAYNLTGTQIGSSTAILGIPAIGGGNNGGDPFSLSSNNYDISYVTLMNLGSTLGGIGEDVIRVDNLTYNTEVSPVPEPSTYALMLGGLGMVGFMAYRRRKTTNV